MDLLQKGGEHVVLVIARDQRSVRKRTAQRGRNAGLIGQHIDTDDSSFHGIVACRLFEKF